MFPEHLVPREIGTREQPLVSVVTPVFNGERYLRECIASVLAQTYSNWEYIIVNNCSTDGTLEIAQEYAAHEPRIRIHSNQEFARVIRNHNIALAQASPESKYIKLVFADDWMYPECLMRMVQVAESSPNVAIVGAYSLRGRKVDWDGLPHTNNVVPGEAICRWRLLGGPYIFGSGTALLMRSDLVRARQPFYNESNLHADTQACYELLQHGDFGFVHRVLTYTHVEEGSLTSFSQKVNTYFPGHLHDLVTYGPVFLNQSELDQRTGQHLDNYYNFLARAVLRRRDKQFWDLHKSKLKDAGFPLNRTRLAVAVARRVLDAVLNPKQTLEALLKRGRAATDPANFDALHVLEDAGRLTARPAQTSVEVVLSDR